ncbi:unnamed protein product [Zymoseptoria tritici ST99CH_1E4]|uniref:F-box domain-containing protein n=1 Tax=Zymoseptoria tritici ST99CH_1E4 TaxID=1276532 RepID=A0A2H1GQD6_ZYMTR|nr:unnamed protein product [Zymoseptoria tritici ST99CH_1E4]
MVTVPETSNAAAQFFGIYEMVEQVMQYMEPAHILRSQKVSRTFREVVRSSPRVQTAAYLRPPIDARRLIWQVVYRGSQPFKIIYHPCRTTYWRTRDLSPSDRYSTGLKRLVIYIGEEGCTGLSPIQPNPSILKLSTPPMINMTLCGCPTCVTAEDMGERFPYGNDDRQPSTAMIFPNAIVISTLNARNTFASFVARDSTYEFS